MTIHAPQGLCGHVAVLRISRSHPPRPLQRKIIFIRGWSVLISVSSWQLNSRLWKGISVQAELGSAVCTILASRPVPRASMVHNSTSIGSHNSVTLLGIPLKDLQELRKKRKEKNQTDAFPPTHKRAISTLPHRAVCLPAVPVLYPKILEQ